jgi:hypothetical protein
MVTHPVTRKGPVDRIPLTGRLTALIAPDLGLYVAGPSLVLNRSSADGASTRSRTARDLRVDAAGGSRVELRGQAARVDVTSTGGADVELGDFDADIAAVDGSGGGSVRVRVHNRLEHCTAVGGTNVRYTGSPALGKVTTSAGGTCNPA